jgi:RNA polymerase sigma-70 factor (ECF subfamily)
VLTTTPGRGEHKASQTERSAPERFAPASLATHLDALQREARRLCRSREDAEDLVQDVCAQVLARPRWISGDGERAYLVRVMRNTFISRLRTAARRPRVVSTLDDHSFAERSTRSRPETAIENMELLESIDALSDRFRHALVAVDIVGLSYGEAAQALHVPCATVTTRLYRARQQVKRALTLEDAAA